MRYKFSTLEHNGVLFPEEYIPSGYRVNNIELSPLAEEMLFAYSGYIETDYVKDKVFRDNFWSCLKKELPASLRKLKFPEDFSKTLKAMFDKKQEIKAEKAAYRKEHKKEIEEDKKTLKEQYGYAIVDGERVPLGMYVIEGPGIMMARGQAKTRGLWKYRVKPEDVIINWKSNKEPPSPPKSHKWKGLESKSNQSIASYEIRVGEDFYVSKGILFSAQSDYKKNSDMVKFENARKLVKNWKKIEKYIANGIASENQKIKQSALISWLIIKTGIRVGSDFDPRENGVVGASSLKVSNISIKD